MSRSAWYRFIRQTQLTGGSPQLLDPPRVHDGGSRLQASVELEFYASFLLDARAFGDKKVVKCLQCLLALAAGPKLKLTAPGIRAIACSELSVPITPEVTTRSRPRSSS